MDATWRRTNLGHLLYAATNQCIGDKLRVVSRAGFDITDAQLALFQNLDKGGARLTTVAARAGLAKQSMIELVDRAEAAGFIERTPDPEDRRAKLVSLSTSGRRLVRKLRDGVAEAERGFAETTGEPRVAAIKRELQGYVRREDATPAVTQGEAWRTDNIERVLAAAARQFVRDVLAAVHRHGHRDVTEALLALFRNLELEGSRLTDLATTARMTKQSMRELVDRAERLGYVERVGDPSDGRAKVIRFSATGLTMLEAMRDGVSAAEAQFAGSTSPDVLADLKADLSTYLAASDR